MVQQDHSETRPKHCPSCGIKGQPIDTATVRSVLSVSLRLVKDTPYRFCATPNCQVVYFNADGEQAFTIHDVRERVYQKEPDSADVLICYCFQHSIGSIQAEIETTGNTTVIDIVQEGIQAGQCACDWRNPQGTCCLGNVRRFVQRHLAKKAQSNEV